MERLSYREAENKIFDAYFKDEIQPYCINFCFCGTLSGKKTKGYYWNRALYTAEEYVKMEHTFLTAIRDEIFGKDSHFNIYLYNGINYLDRFDIKENPNYEDAVFKGMCAAMEVLKNIHRERGENVDETKVLRKRELAQ